MLFQGTLDTEKKKKRKVVWFLLKNAKETEVTGDRSPTIIKEYKERVTCIVKEGQSKRNYLHPKQLRNPGKVQTFRRSYSKEGCFKT